MLSAPDMRTPYVPADRRRILCVYPRYARSFGTFPVRVSVLRRSRARLHVAARLAGHGGLPAGVVGGPVRRRELAAGHPGGLPLGGRRVRLGHAHSTNADSRRDRAGHAHHQTVVVGVDSYPAARIFHRQHPVLERLRPILDAVRRINDHGMEVVSGIIVGLDTDGPETGDHIVEFIRRSNIPILTINILYALPKTPLWKRLEAAGRLVPDRGRESNVAFKLPYDEVEGLSGQRAAGVMGQRADGARRPRPSSLSVGIRGNCRWTFWRESPPDRVHARLPASHRRVVVLRSGRRRARHTRSRHHPEGAGGGSCFQLRRFGGVSPEVVVAFHRRQARWNLFPMKEVAHDAIRDGPVVAIHAVVMRA